MSKIFGVGLQRSGTTSLAHALVDMGYKTCHYVVHDDEIKMADAIVDAPVFSDYAKLDAEYPGSKFICTVRNLDQWARSFKIKVVDKHIQNNTKPTTMNLRCNHAVFGTLDRTYLTNLDFLKQKHDEHIKALSEYFSNKKDHFLILAIDEDNAMEKLASFLGRPFQLTLFPHDLNPSTHGWESFEHPLKIRKKR